MASLQRLNDRRSRSPDAEDVDAPPQRQRSVTRKRAPTACNLCRQRKTKCDNASPSCGFCIFVRVPCVYSDTRNGSSSEPRPVEPSNSEILERLNHVVTLLEDRDGIRPLLNRGSEDVLLEAQAADPGSNTSIGHSDFTDAGFGQLEISEKAACTVSCESILRWPTFSGLTSYQNIKSFALVSDDDADISSPDWPTHIRPARPALASEDILPLCNKFQALILVKNPSMTSREFSKYAREVAENGPGWDGPSCLVVSVPITPNLDRKLVDEKKLLACALACLATPFQPSDNVLDTSSGPLSSFIDHVDKPAAEGYYMAAQKRLSLSHSTLIAVQCYYFAGLFEKFSLRPLRAWSHLQQACIHFQTGIWKRVNSVAGSNPATSHHTRHFEQRLYWSCVKAECELRAEIQFPSSGLLNFKYPENFLALSMPVPPPRGSLALSDSQGDEFSTDLFRLNAEEEESWLYYLAEISLRRIANRILEHIYASGELSWNAPYSHLLEHFASSQEELLLWHSHLPKQLHFDDGLPARNDLSFQLQTRYNSYQEWIRRPFLYRILHEAPSSPEHLRKDLALADQCLGYACKLISAVSRSNRFGGIWFNMRRSFSAALLLLASVRNKNMNPPQDWHSSVTLAIQTLMLWETEAADLKRCRQILESILDSVSIPSITMLQSPR